MSDTFCVAVDEITGEAWMYDGTSWSVTERLAQHGFEDVSCASPSWCVAADYGSVYMWDGSGWSDAVVMHPAFSPWRMCRAPVPPSAWLSTNGRGYAFDGTSWSRALPARRDCQAISVSCRQGVRGSRPSGDAVALSRRWRIGTAVSPGRAPEAVCVFVLTVLHGGRTTSATPSGSSAVNGKPREVVAGPYYTATHAGGVSVRHVSAAVALGSDHKAVTYRDRTWSKPRRSSTALLRSRVCRRRSGSATGASPRGAAPRRLSLWSVRVSPGR